MSEGTYHEVHAKASDNIFGDILHVADYMRALILVLKMASFEVFLQGDSEVSLVRVGT